MTPLISRSRISSGADSLRAIEHRWGEKSTRAKNVALFRLGAGHANAKTIVAITGAIPRVELWTDLRGV